MRGAFTNRLIICFLSLLLFVAANANGYAQRPSLADSAFQTYLLLGGDPADLCADGGATPGHVHCLDCQTAGSALPAVTGGLSHLDAFGGYVAFARPEGGPARPRASFVHARGPPGPA